MKSTDIKAEIEGKIPPNIVSQLHNIGWTPKNVHDIDDALQRIGSLSKSTVSFADGIIILRHAIDKGHADQHELRRLTEYRYYLTDPRFELWVSFHELLKALSDAVFKDGKAILKRMLQ